MPAHGKGGADFTEGPKPERNSGSAVYQTAAHFSPQAAGQPLRDPCTVEPQKGWLPIRETLRSEIDPREAGVVAVLVDPGGQKL